MVSLRKAERKREKETEKIESEKIETDTGMYLEIDNGGNTERGKE
jgi:hypothetical protein